MEANDLDKELNEAILKTVDALCVFKFYGKNTESVIDALYNLYQAKYTK